MEFLSYQGLSFIPFDCDIGSTTSHVGDSALGVIFLCCHGCFFCSLYRQQRSTIVLTLIPPNAKILANIHTLLLFIFLFPLSYHHHISCHDQSKSCQKDPHCPWTSGLRHLHPHWIDHFQIYFPVSFGSRDCKVSSCICIFLPIHIIFKEIFLRITLG